MKHDMAQFFSKERYVQPVGLFTGTAGEIRTNKGSVILNAEGQYSDDGK